MSNYNTSNTQQSEFNAALSQIFRIDALLTSCINSQTAMDIDAWMKSLFALWTEVSAELTDSEIQSFQTEQNEINAMYQSVQKQRAFNNFNSFNNSGSQIINSKVFMRLQNFEIKIRRVLKKKGLLSKMRDDHLMAMV